MQPNDTNYFGFDQAATPAERDEALTAAVQAALGDEVIAEPIPVEETTAEEAGAVEIARAPYLAVGESLTQEIADALIAAYGDAVDAELAAIHDEVIAQVPAQAIDAYVATADDLMHWNGGYTPYLRGRSDDDIFLGHYTFSVGDTSIRLFVGLRWDTGEIVSADVASAIDRYATYFAETPEDA